MKTSESEKYFNRAKKVLVGGVNSPVRSFNGVGGQPLIMKKAERQKLYDQDGNVYTDYCLSWGSLIHGHAHRNITLAAKKTVERGASFGTTTRAEVEIAEEIVKAVPSIEKIRFVNSGTEATMSAIRLARGFTGRSMVVKFDGCYHGHFDDLLTTAGSGVAALHESSSQGIPKSHIENTLSLPFNDCAVLEKTISEYKDKIACVIIEPVAGNMGVIPATKVFLNTLRDLTQQHNIILIFDEIMTGFRTNRGCVQSDYNVLPDMTCLGKIIGGGFPMGAYGGREDIMNFLAPLGGVYQAGTFSGNPVVMYAGLAAVRLLNTEFYKALNQRCTKFVEDLNRFFRDEHVDAHLSAYYGMMSIRFRKEEVLNYKDAQNAAGGARYGELFHYLLQKGVYLPPADLEAFFISSVHSTSDLKYLGEQIKSFFSS